MRIYTEFKLRCLKNTDVPMHLVKKEQKAMKVKQ